MSIKVMTWTWDNTSVGGTELLVMLALADCANDEGGHCWPSISTLARKCRIDQRTAQRVLKRLADAGLITIGEFNPGEFKGLPKHGKGRLTCFRCFTLK